MKVKIDVGQVRAMDDGAKEQVVAKVRDSLLRWYATNGRRFPWRRKRAGLYCQIVAELLLQRTRAETVATFFGEFLARFPSWQALSEASIEEIGAFLKPIGLWKRRAVSLSALAKLMATKRGRFPRQRDSIELLPGVGQYVANSILLFAAGQAEPLLDVNMARVLERVFGPRKLVDIRYDPYLQELSRLVVRGEQAAEVNWAILDLAATACKQKTPLCNVCPLREFCCYANQPHESCE